MRDGSSGGEREAGGPEGRADDAPSQTGVREDDRTAPAPQKLHARVKRALQELRLLRSGRVPQPRGSGGGGQRLVVLLVAGLFTIVLVVGWVYLARRDYQEVLRGAEQNLLSYALALEEHARRSFESTFLALGRVIDHKGGRELREWAATREAWVFAKTISSELPQVAGITVIDADGVVRMTTSGFPWPPAIDVRDREYFLAHAVRGEARHLGPLIIDRATGKPVFTLSRQLVDAEGRFNGVALAWMDVGYFRRFYRSLDIGSRSAVSLLRSDGRLFIREPMRTIHVGLDLSLDPIFTEDLRRESSGFAIYDSPFDGEERLIAFRKATDYPVVVLAGRAVAEIYRPVAQRVLGAGVTIAVFLVIIWSSARVQLRAIDRARRARRKLADSRDFADSILDSVRSHIAILDADGRIVRANLAWREFARANGLDDDTIGWNYFEVCRRAAIPDAEAAAAGIASVIVGARESFHMDYACHSPGEKRWFTMHVTPLSGKEGQVVVSHENITRLKEVEETLRNLATIDALTGLLNRRMLVEHGEEEFARAKRYGQEFSLIMIDCDHFKRINDRYGHAVGDRVLVCLADRIRACMRDTDHAGRIGGEEFVVLLPNTTREGAIHLALRIRDAVRAAVVSLQGVHVSFTVSLGVSSMASVIGSFDDLLRAADGALYLAKDRGRDRVEAG